MTGTPFGTATVELMLAADGSARLLLPDVPATRRAGLDLLDVHRLGRAVARTGPALERRICTHAELRALPAAPRARLAALARALSIKESTIKALGGMPRGGTFHDVCTAGRDGGAAVRDVAAGHDGAAAVRDGGAAGPGGGAPGRAVRLDGALARRAAALGVQVVAGSRDLPGTDADLLLSWAVAVPEPAEPAVPAVSAVPR